MDRRFTTAVIAVVLLCVVAGVHSYSANNPSTRDMIYKCSVCNRFVEMFIKEFKRTAYKDRGNYRQIGHRIDGTKGGRRQVRHVGSEDHIYTLIDTVCNINITNGNDAYAHNITADGKNKELRYDRYYAVKHLCNNHWDEARRSHYCHAVGSVSFGDDENAMLEAFMKNTQILCAEMLGDMVEDEDDNLLGRYKGDWEAEVIRDRKYLCYNHKVCKEPFDEEKEAARTEGLKKIEADRQAKVNAERKALKDAKQAETAEAAAKNAARVAEMDAKHQAYLDEQKAKKEGAAKEEVKDEV